MVHKMKRQRGRPKTYDAESALQAATDVFWTKGFSATSLDDLSAAMGMNRPSIYRAFGDKEAIYRQALAQFSNQMEEGFNQSIRKEPDFQKGLRKFYRAAIEVYFAGGAALGCMVMCTAPAASAIHPEVQLDLLKVIEELDGRILKRVDQAIEQREISAACDPQTLSKLIQAVLHSLAIRVRAGQSRASLRKFADGATGLLLGEI